MTSLKKLDNKNLASEENSNGQNLSGGNSAWGNPNKKNSIGNLLPSGFYDLLFVEAKKNHDLINQILNGFFAKNFNLIKTALLEFEENFDETSRRGANQYFRSIDNVSGKSLILRSDITLQINRLLSSRLKDIQFPLKLCYVGDVFRTNNEELYGDRQQTQIGCEIIGDDSNDADFVIIETTLQALDWLGLERLIINFSFPDFLTIFINELSLDQETKITLAEKIAEKNLSAIKELAPKYFSAIKEIILNNHDFFSLVAIIKKYFLSTSLINQLEKIEKIRLFINGNFAMINQTFNLFSDGSNQYHKGFAFEIFYENFSYPLAIGGRYEINNSRKKVEAVGSTIYINNLRKIDL